ncbi:hypothetical protein GC174_17815 [bacterium]|nr:hypothetical protein [bacterium]
MERAESFRSQVDRAAEILDAIYSNDTDSERAEAHNLDRFLVSPETMRAFFVSWLSDDWSLDNKPSERIFEILRNKDATCAEVLAEILVKNLTMSSAMVLRHRQDGRDDLAKGSLTVQNRTGLVMERLGKDKTSALSTCLQSKSRELLAAIESAKSDTDKDMPFKDFLTRWNYDLKQLDAMEDSLNSVFKTIC